MSAYTTLSVSRAAAIEVLTKQMFERISDEQLGNMLDPYVNHALFNVLVESERNGPDDDRLHLYARQPHGR